MEDALGVGSDEHCAVVCVCDGHGGSLVSKRVAQILPTYMRKIWETEDVAPAYHDMCVQIDEQLRLFKGEGCAACAVAFDATTRRCTLLNVGDTEAWVYRAGAGTIEKVHDIHTTSHPAAQERISRCEGARICTSEDMGELYAGRVETKGSESCNYLNLTHAFGDHDDKTTNGGPAEFEAISPVPVVRHFMLGPKDAVFIMCDGVTESLNRDTCFTAGGEVHRSLQEVFVKHQDTKVDDSETAHCMGDFLLRTMKDRSSDNMTLCMVTPSSLTGDGEKPRKATQRFVSVLPMTGYMRKEDAMLHAQALSDLRQSKHAVFDMHLDPHVKKSLNDLCSSSLLHEQHHTRTTPIHTSLLRLRSEDENSFLARMGAKKPTDEVKRLAERIYAGIIPPGSERSIMDPSRTLKFSGDTLLHCLLRGCAMRQDWKVWETFQASHREALTAAMMEVPNHLGFTPEHYIRPSRASTSSNTQQ